MDMNEKRKMFNNESSQGSTKEAKVSIDKKVYTIWNNKGGVGKTTLTFHIATQYAKTHPTDRVVVIDMCPQANVSSALLGCASKGESDLLSDIKHDKVREYFGEDLDESQDYFKSISGYLLMRVHNKQPQWDPTKYLVKVADYNKNIPGNLFLLLGDDTLELTIKQVEFLRNKPKISDEDKPWKEGTLLIRSMLDKLAKKYAKLNVTGLTVFIDTNPAFSVYTELAVAAADKLITPVNADDFSRAAVNAMLANVYGYDFNPSYEDVCFREQKKYVFSYRAPEEGLVLPRLHLAINNRVTLYNFRSSKSFNAMGNCVVNALYEAYKKKPEIFSTTDIPKENSKYCFGLDYRMSKDDFKQRFFHELKDFHKTAVHSIHTGTPLASMHSSTVLIGDTKDQVSKEQVTSCLENVNQIVRML